MISGYLVIGLFGFAVGSMLGVHAGYRMGHREGRRERLTNNPMHNDE